jgi:predicted O-methyltransferase YrrM
MCASIVEVLDYLKKRPPAYHIMIDMQACGYVVMTEFQNRYWPFKMDGSSYSKGYRSPLLHGVEIVNDFNDNYEVRSKKRPHVEGWCTDEKSKLMTDLVRKVRPNLCVEIGVFGGKSLIPIAQCIKDEDLECVIYGIDPWSTHFCLEYMEHPTQIAWWSNEDLLSHYVRLCETLTSTRLWEQVRLLCAPSHTVVNTFYNESIDIIHIDGNHEVIPSSRDVKLYLPKVKHKGYIWMDDANWATLQPAISIIKEECDLVIDKKDYQLYQKR